MAQIIQHNIMALNSFNRLSTNNSLLSKNLEKLSSGYKINRAGDDAAGLAISEKMRAQITGLERASDNAQDGISLVQTAEGALTEVHSMLNRMVELATQSANGTYDGTDRDKLQSEIDSLQDEIDRIATETNFNGIKLLDGSLGAAAKVATDAGKAAVGGAKYMNKMTVTAGTATAATDDTIVISYNDGTTAKTLTITAKDAADHANGQVIADDLKTAAEGGNGLKALIDTLAAAGFDEAEAFKATFDVTAGSATEFTVEAKEAKAGVTMTSIAITTADGSDTPSTYTLGTGTDTVAGANPTTAATGAVTTLDFTGKKAANVIGSTITVNGTTYELVKSGEAATGTNTAIDIEDTDEAADIASAVKDAIGDVTTTGTGADTYTAALDGTKVTFTSATTGTTAEALTFTQTGKGLGLQIGDTASQKISVNVTDMGTQNLGVKGLDITTEDDASAAIDTIKAAINKVSTQRSDLGAIQNRLEYTINNLATTTENLTSAESRIRDTDMAKEMMAYTKNNVLAQAAQAMLAQANQQPQQVLQLLQ